MFHFYVVPSLKQEPLIKVSVTNITFNPSFSVLSHAALLCLVFQISSKLIPKYGKTSQLAVGLVQLHF